MAEGQTDTREDYDEGQQGDREQLLPALRAVAELHGMLADLNVVNERRPDMYAKCAVELAHALDTTARAIRRGFVSTGQLVDVRRRASFIKTQAGRD